ncbi:MAG: phosphoglycerate dehydrogenase [Desulfatibacillaceae bacterium]
MNKDNMDPIFGSDPLEVVSTDPEMCTDVQSVGEDKTFRILVSDKLGEKGIRMLRDEPGIEVDVNTGLAPEELLEIIGDYDGLIIRSATKVTEQILEKAENLKVVGRAGIGLDNVDIPVATSRGVAVMNTPKGNVVTTAEHAISMLMALTRNIPRGTASMKAGRWDKKLLQGREVMNKNLGLIGYGKIGSVVADRARGLRMNVLVYDPVVPREKIEKDGHKPVDLDELYAQADYISIHVPKGKKTLNLLNKAAFDKMKEGVMIINCARGGIVNEQDLHDALTSGKVAGAALDVFETEPPGEHPLFELDNVVATPHLGASTREAQTNVAVQVAEQMIKYLKDNTAVNTVNVPQISGKVLEKLAPFLTLGERMGLLLSQIIEGHIKAVEIEYIGDIHQQDMSPVTTSILTGLLSPLASDEVNFVNAPSLAKQMGIKISEATSAESYDYSNLIRVTVKTEKKDTVVAGTLFGKNYPRIVGIDMLRLEMIPAGYFAILEGNDDPGSIGNIGSLLGKKDINIARMTVGQDVDGTRNKIFIRTDEPMPRQVVEELQDLTTVNAIHTFEL